MFKYAYTVLFIPNTDFPRKFTHKLETSILKGNQEFWNPQNYKPYPPAPI